MCKPMARDHLYCEDFNGRTATEHYVTLANANGAFNEERKTSEFTVECYSTRKKM